MRRQTIYLIIISFVIGFLIGLTTSRLNPTGQAILEKSYSYTTAICRENKCLDVNITCENGIVKSITPTTELIQLPEDWEDLRPKKDSFCE